MNGPNSVLSNSSQVPPNPSEHPRAPSSTPPSQIARLASASFGGSETLHTTSGKQSRFDAWGAAAESVLLGITQAFKRLFGTPTPEEKQFVQGLTDNITYLSTSLKGAKQAWSTFKSTKFPEKEKALAARGQVLTEVRNQLKEANLALGNLKERATSLKELSDTYRAYSALPRQVEELQKRVEYLSEKMDLFEKLFALEGAINSYADHSLKTGTQGLPPWTSFQSILQASSELAGGVKRALKDRQKPVDEGRGVSPDEIRRVIKRLHPDLSVQTEHVFGHVEGIWARRFEALSMQTRLLQGLLSDYEQNERHISGWNQDLTNPSLGALAKRTAFGVSYFTSKIEKALSENAALKDGIRAKAFFESAEVEYLGKTKSCAELYDAIKKCERDIQEKNLSTQEITELYQELGKGQGAGGTPSTKWQSWNAGETVRKWQAHGAGRQTPELKESSVLQIIERDRSRREDKAFDTEHTEDAITRALGGRGVNVGQVLREQLKDEEDPPGLSF